MTTRFAVRTSLAVALALGLLLILSSPYLSGAFRGPTEALPGVGGVYALPPSASGARSFLLRDAAFYPNAYLAPGALSGVPPSPFSECQYATQRMIINAPHGDIYALRFMLPGYAGRVFVNGELVREIGVLGTEPGEIQIGYKWCALGATPKNGQIELVVQAANFSRANQGVEPLRVEIGRAAELEPQNLFTNLNSLSVMGALFGASLLLLGIWLFTPKLKQNLWFALVCLGMSARAGLTGDMIQRVYPALPRWLALRMEYASAPLIILFAALYFTEIFPFLYTKKWWKYAGGAVPLYVGLVFLLPTQATSRLFPLLYAAIVAVILHFVASLCKNLRNPSPDQPISLAGVAVFMLGMLGDTVYFSGLVPFQSGRGTIAELATLCFVLLQMIALFTGNALRTAEAEASRQRLIAEKEALDRISRLKTEFVGDVSHELKTPLTVISGYAQTAQRELRSGAPEKNVERSLSRITSEADRLALLVTQVLDVTRIQEGRFCLEQRPEDLMEIIQSTMQAYAPLFSRNGNLLEIDPSGGDPVVLCDRQRIAQVIANLLANAARHTREGTITISVGRRGGMAEVRVRDNGEGIPPDRLPWVFDRYHTHTNNARPGIMSGTGLGLYISKHIVEEHGGEISLESEEGKGTVVRFTLPLKSEPA